MSILPWSSGQLLVWDATCSDIFAASNLWAANWLAKYSHLDSSYLFVPVLVETSGSLGQALEPFEEVERKVRQATKEEKTHRYFI